MSDSPLNDIFDIFFGQAGPRRGANMMSRGDDLRYDLELTLEEAATGVEKTLKYTRMETCETCSGSGERPGASADTCPQCQGAGQIRYTQNTQLGVFATMQTCTRCRGMGKVITDPCTDCSGSGQIRRQRERKIQIPAGVDTGMRLPLRGEGDAGRRGGSAGDLTLFLFVKEHEVFERRGNDIICEVPIRSDLAAQGGIIEVPVINGTEELRIPEGTQSATQFTLHGQGIPDINGRGNGDLHVVVRVQVPPD